MSLVKFHIDECNDYSYNFSKLPKGVGGEIFSMNALAKSWKYGQEFHHREHVNEYILEHPDDFKIGYHQPKKSKEFPELALTIDTRSDYKRIYSLLLSTKQSSISTEELILKCLSSA